MSRRGWRFILALGAILPLLALCRPGGAHAAVDIHEIHLHAVGGTFTCADCHTGSAHNSGSVSGGSGSIEVPTGSNSLKFNYIDDTEDAGTRGTYSAGVCSNADCHGGDGSTTSNINNIATIAEVQKCGNCHYVGTADVDDFSYGNRTLAKVNSTQWGDSGHGKSGSYDVSNNTGANFAGPNSDPEGCAYCHDLGVEHGVAANPFRLKDHGTAGGDWNDVCLICHASGDSGYQPPGGYTLRGSGNGSGKAVDANHSGASHVNAADGGKFCWDCHDPHGDRSGSTGNIYMVQSNVSVASDGTYGIPATNGSVTFTTKTLPVAVGYYVEGTNTPARGICQACHTDVGGFPGEVKYWRNNQTEDADANNVNETPAVADRHNATAVCTDCHKHDNEFAAGCTDCHGDNTAGSYWPDGDDTNNPNRSDYADDAGAHAKHITAIYNANSSTLPPTGGTATEKKNNTCGWCHPGNPPPGHPSDATSGSYQAEVTRMDKNGDGFQTTPRGSDDYWYFAGGATATSGTAVYFKTLSGANDVETAYYKLTDKTCLNTACHSQASPSWYGGADTTPPTVGNVRVNGSTTPSIQKGTATVTLTADASDASIIVAGEYFVATEGAAGSGTAMDAQAAPFDSTSETLIAVVNTSGWDTGTQTLYVDAKDAGNNWGPPTAASIQVTVTAPDSFTVAHTNGSTGNVTPGQANILMQTVTVSVSSGTVDLTDLEVTGTQDGGDSGNVANDVLWVKVFKDNGGVGTFEPGSDTQIGAAQFINTQTKKAEIDITDQNGVSGTMYLYLVYDLTGGATVGDDIGAQLSGVTHGSGDTLLTALPIPSPAVNNKTIVSAGDTTPPTVTTLLVNGVTNLEIVEDDPTTEDLTLTAVANDTQSNIAAGEYFIDIEGDPGNGIAMSPSDGGFDETNEDMTGTVDTRSWTAANSPYRIYVDCKDAAGNWGPVNAAWIDVTVRAVDLGIPGN